MAIRLPAFLFWVIESICDSERRHCRPEISMSTSPTLAIPEPGDVFAQLTSCQRLLTARDVAKILAISEKTVYSYVSRNMIPYYKIEAMRPLSGIFRVRSIQSPDAGKWSSISRFVCPLFCFGLLNLYVIQSGVTVARRFQCQPPPR